MVRHLVRVARGYGGPYAREPPDADGFISLEHLRWDADLITQHGWHLDPVLKGIRAHSDARNQTNGPRFVFKNLGGNIARMLKTRPNIPCEIPLPKTTASLRQPLWNVGAWFRLNRASPQGTRLVLWNAPPMTGTHCHNIYDADAVFLAVAILRSKDRITAQIVTPEACPLTGPFAFINLWGAPDRVGRGSWEPSTGISLAEEVPCPYPLAAPNGVPSASLPPVDANLLVAESSRPPSRPSARRQSLSKDKRRDPGMDLVDLPV